MDSAIYQGYAIPPFYDSLIGKLIIHAENRQAALGRLSRALQELIVDGIETTTSLFENLLDEKDIQSGNYSIHWLENWLDKNSKEKL
jgi:Biotin carboxylase